MLRSVVSAAAANMMLVRCNSDVAISLACSMRIGNSPDGLVGGIWVAAWRGGHLPCQMTKSGPFQYFKTSPEIIRLTVMMYIRFPPSLRNV